MLPEPKLHPYAELFPAMSDEEFKKLVLSIKEQGQVEPCLMFNGELVDGRHRWAACLAQEPQIAPKTAEWDGKGSLLDIVVAKNAQRRETTKSQKVASAYLALPHYQKEAAARQKAGVSLKVGEGATSAGKAAEKAAAAFGVSRAYIEELKRIDEANKTKHLPALILAGTLKLAKAIKDNTPANDAATAGRDVESRVDADVEALPKTPDVQLWVWSKGYVKGLVATLKELEDRGANVGEMLTHARAIAGELRTLKSEGKGAKKNG